MPITITSDWWHAWQRTSLMSVVNGNGYLRLIKARQRVAVDDRHLRAASGKRSLTVKCLRQRLGFIEASTHLRSLQFIVFLQRRM